MHHHDDTPLTPEQLADVRRRGDAELQRLGFSRRGLLQAGMAALAASGRRWLCHHPERAPCVSRSRGACEPG